MNTDALQSTLLSLTVLSEKIHFARTNVSAEASDDPFTLREFLDAVEHDLGIAKATLASELGFPVCQCCWPPELCVIDAKDRAYCPASRKGAMSAPPAKSPRGAAVLRVAPKPSSIHRFTGAQKLSVLEAAGESAAYGCR